MTQRNNIIQYKNHPNKKKKICQRENISTNDLCFSTKDREDQDKHKNACRLRRKTRAKEKCESLKTRARKYLLINFK